MKMKLKDAIALAIKRNGWGVSRVDGKEQLNSRRPRDDTDVPARSCCLAVPVAGPGGGAGSRHRKSTPTTERARDLT